VVIVFISSDPNELNSRCKFILLTVRARYPDRVSADWGQPLTYDLGIVAGKDVATSSD
jgi:hypothetical protein